MARGRMEVDIELPAVHDLEGQTVVVRQLTTDDLDWVVDLLAGRRTRLEPFAPVLWRSATDARRSHARFLEHLLTHGGQGYRTDSGFLIACPGPHAWMIDDMVVPPAEWATTGRALWEAFATASPDATVRLVCPVPEPDRTQFAVGRGLAVTNSWWHHDALHPAPGAHRDPRVAGATVSIVVAPPIYDPGGPILFLTDVVDPDSALTMALDEAAELGCPAVVVNQPQVDTALGSALDDAGYTRHCDFFGGTVTS